LSQNGTGADTGPNGMLSTGYITTAGMVKHFRQLVHVMDGYNVHAPCPHTPDHFHLEWFILHYEYQCTFSIMIKIEIEIEPPLKYLDPEYPRFRTSTPHRHKTIIQSKWNVGITFPIRRMR
jgi:hypothetical protein